MKRWWSSFIDGMASITLFPQDRRYDFLEKTDKQLLEEDWQKVMMDFDKVLGKSEDGR